MKESGPSGLDSLFIGIACLHRHDCLRSDYFLLNFMSVRTLAIAKLLTESLLLIVKVRNVLTLPSEG